jgi:antitoxin YokJ
LSIDTDPTRNGRCYDSFHDVHGIVGSDPVIARSFAELFERLLDSGGGHWYWLEPDFVSLGDAYDE